MRQSILTKLLVFCALLALALPAIEPLLTASSGTLPLTDDGGIHTLRAIAYRHATTTDAGLWPPYVPGIATGYGAPLFTYFPPTAYLVPAGLGALGLSGEMAWRCSLAMYALLMAGGAYALGNRWGGSQTGFLLAAGNVYAPYVLFDAYTRGTSSEYLGLAILPWALWALTRWVQDRRPIDLLLSSGFIASLVLVHNIVALLGGLLIAGYSIGLWWSSIDGDESTSRIGRAIAIAIAGITSLALSAFFWWPALTETDAVKIDAVAEALDFIDVARTLRPLTEIFALPQTADVSLQNAQIPIAFSWWSIVLVSGLVLKRREDDDQSIPRWLVLWGIGFVVMATAGQLPFVAPLTDEIPFFGYLQFAWRLMILGTLPLTILAAIGATHILDQIPSQSLKNAIFCALLAGHIIYGAFWLYRPQIAFSADSINDVHEYERATGQIALSSFGEYLPTATIPENLDTNALRERYAESTDGRIARLAMIPDGMTILAATYTGTSAQLHYEANEASMVIFDWLHMRNWTAEINGERLITGPQPEDGRLTINLPAGTHELDVRFRASMGQRISRTVSTLTVVALTLSVMIWHLKGRTSAARPANAPQTNQIALFALSTAIALLVFKIGVLDRYDSVIERTAYDELEFTRAGVNKAQNVRFSGGIQLLGFIIPQARTNGANATISLFWRIESNDSDRDVSSSVLLIDAAGHVVAQSSNFAPGGIPSSTWLSRLYIQDNHELTVTQDLPPGEYGIQIVLTDAASGGRLDVIDTNGNPLAAAATVGTQTVQRVSPDRHLEQEMPAARKLTDALSLVSLVGLPDVASAGDALRWDWRWLATINPDRDHRAQLQWRQNGVLVAETLPLPLTPGFPTSQWQRDDIWRGAASSFVPGSLDTGIYDIAVAIDEAHVTVATMQVVVPERSYEIPPFAEPSSVRWDNGIALLGSTIDGQTVTLHWQTDQVIQQQLRLFVQVFEGDELLAVWDRIPERAAPGWDVGEVVTTTHPFDIDIAGKRVMVGWYPPEGGRIPTSTGSDFVVIRSEDAD